MKVLAGPKPFLEALGGNLFPAFSIFQRPPHSLAGGPLPRSLPPASKPTIGWIFSTLHLSYIFFFYCCSHEASLILAAHVIAFRAHPHNPGNVHIPRYLTLTIQPNPSKPHYKTQSNVPGNRMSIPLFCLPYRISLKWKGLEGASDGQTLFPHHLTNEDTESRELFSVTLLATFSTEIGSQVSWLRVQSSF